MKNLKTAAIAIAMLFVGSVAANAQQKIGYVDAEGIVAAMPDLKEIQTKMDAFAKDSIGGEYERLSKDYKIKDSIYKDAKTIKQVKDAVQKDLVELEQVLANWQESASQVYEFKRNQLMVPVYKKVREAIIAVSKEKGYTYIADENNFIVKPEADNLSKAVAQKLNITYTPPKTN